MGEREEIDMTNGQRTMTPLTQLTSFHEDAISKAVQVLKENPDFDEVRLGFDGIMGITICRDTSLKREEKS